MQVLKIENLSKQYFLGGRSSNSLRDAVVSLWKNRDRVEKRELWALKDVTFDVDEGDTLAIIGRNGAGKSTLLKILSRITKPTRGSIEIRGRVSSLLEVGTGFQSELTGRENTYLNGAILGMKRAEIDKKFDEIVAFSEIGEFLDTPVKFYSSGMNMRLAFSVAAHLEPEILIVDEVLAVGDAEFQKKCLGKMHDVSSKGRTVIFVSHQMGSVAQLCQKAILLDKGTLVMEGKTSEVIEHYLNQGKFNLATYHADESATLRDMYVKIVTITNKDLEEKKTFRHDEPIQVNVTCFAKRMIRGSELRMEVRDGRGIKVFTADCELKSLNDTTKEFEVVFTTPAETLRPNNYSLTFLLFVPHQLLIEMIENVVFFSVFDSGTKYAQSEGMDYGLIFSPCKYSVKQIS